jgi:ribonuclease HI
VESDKKDIEGKEGIIKEEIVRFIEKTANKSRYEKDAEEKWMIADKKIKIYSDGSAKERRAAAGTWEKRYTRLRVSFRVYGDQDVFNGELQGALYAINNIPREVEGKVYIDNAAVVRLGKTIKEWGPKEWKKCPQPEIARLFLQTLKRKEKEGAIIKIRKVKGHAGIEGNEEADKRAKRGLQEDRTYINKRDLLEHRNDIDLKKKEMVIKSNYRKEIKK